jgi:glycosyltransferase involved in cell wall biosynthesis
VERRGVPDVVHAHSARWAGAAAARIQEALGVPYVLTEHFSGFQRASIRPWRRSLVERGLSRARGLAAVSTALKNALAAQGLAAPEDVAVHPNLVRTSFFVRPSEGRPAKPPFRFVTVAGLNSRKNVAGLIESFAQAFGAAEATSLTIVGDGPRRRALKEQARRHNVASRVAFLGRRDRAGVRDALQAAHAFVLPSRYETFGVALAEAMATGLPVVATRCGGPEDLVTEATGLLVSPEDPAALAEALRTMRARWATYDPERIRASVVDRCGPEPFVQRTRSFYHRARSA